MKQFFKYLVIVFLILGLVSLNIFPQLGIPEEKESLSEGFKKETQETTEFDNMQTKTDYQENEIQIVIIRREYSGNR